MFKHLAVISYWRGLTGEKEPHLNSWTGALHWPVAIVRYTFDGSSVEDAMRAFGLRKIDTPRNVLHDYYCRADGLFWFVWAYNNVKGQSAIAWQNLLRLALR